MADGRSLIPRRTRALLPTPKVVPRNAWYRIPGPSSRYPDVRCTCGCFAEGVRILTSSGYREVQSLAEEAARGSVKVAALGPLGLQGSASLRASDFTVGPEQEKVIVIQTSGGQRLAVTQDHPFPRQTNGAMAMVQASALIPGDELYRADGSLIAIATVAAEHLPEDRKLVFNFDTKAASAEGHIVVANGILTGDLVWQKALSQREGRIANLGTEL